MLPVVKMMGSGFKGYFTVVEVLLFILVVGLFAALIGFVLVCERL